MAKKKPKNPKVPRTRNGNTMTEAEYWGRVRSALRKAFAYWKPAQAVMKEAECGHMPNPKTGRLKKVYLCAACGEVGFANDMQIDHMEPCGSLRSPDDLAPFLERLTCEDSTKFQLLHKQCHQVQTNERRTNNDGV